ncbi:hypothetical protein KEM54_003783, partial [Ascosphaera aggregata]
MGQAGRYTCICTTYIFTIGSLICLMIIGLGMEYSSGPMQRFFFFQLNLVDIKLEIFNGNQQLENIFPIKLYDWYATGLWNSCYGNISPNDTVVREVIGCTALQQRYWFDPYEAPGIKELLTLLQVDIDHSLNLYKRASTALFYFWVFSMVFVLVQALAGFISLYGRGWGIMISIITLMTASLTVILAILSTLLFNTLTEKVNQAIGSKLTIPVHIARVGQPMQATIWIAAAFALIASILWSASTYCCWSRTWENANNDSCLALKRREAASGKYISEDRGEADDDRMTVHKMRDNNSQKTLVMR